MRTDRKADSNVHRSPYNTDHHATPQNNFDSPEMSALHKKQPQKSNSEANSASAEESKKSKKLMDRNAASRIQRVACKNNNGTTLKDSFASRAMSAAYKNEPQNSNSEVNSASEEESKESKKLMDRNAASRIQRVACKNNNGTTPKDSFASRAMSAAYKNEPQNSNSEENSNSKTNSPSKKDPINDLATIIQAGVLLFGTGYVLYKTFQPGGRQLEERKEEAKRTCCPKCTIF